MIVEYLRSNLINIWVFSVLAAVSVRKGFLVICGMNFCLQDASAASCKCGLNCVMGHLWRLNSAAGWKCRQETGWHTFIHSHPLLAALRFKSAHTNPRRRARVERHKCVVWPQSGVPISLLPLLLLVRHHSSSICSVFFAAAHQAPGGRG